MTAENQTIGMIFFIGFVAGAIFSYSGLLGFTGGFTTGVIFTKTYWNEHQANWFQIDDTQNNYFNNGWDWATQLVKKRVLH